MINPIKRPKWKGVWARVSEEFPLCTCESCGKPLYLFLILALEPLTLRRKEHDLPTTQLLRRDSIIILAEPRGSVIETDGGRMLQVAIDFSIVEEVAEKLKLSASLDIHPSIALIDRSLALLLRSLSSALYEPTDVSGLKAELLGRAIAAHALSSAALTHSSSAHESRLDTPDLQWLRMYIKDNIHSRLVDSDLAAKLGISAQTLRRRFKSSIGMTPKAFAMQERIQLATKLLKESNLSIGDVAHSCGFSDHSHLCAAFIRHLGQSPTEVRNGGSDLVWTEQ